MGGAASARGVAGLAGGAGPSALGHVAFTPGPLFGRLMLSKIVGAGVGLQLAPLLLHAGHLPAVAVGLTGLLGPAALQDG